MVEVRKADPGCNAGLERCESAMRAAHVVDIEGRGANLAKAASAKEAVGLDNLPLLQRTSSPSPRTPWGFDLVPRGLLHHLDARAVHVTLQKREVCDGVAIVDPP